jgi:hypothetical protein
MGSSPCSEDTNNAWNLTLFYIRHYGIVLKGNTLYFIIIIIIIIITLSFLFCSQVLCEVEWALECLKTTIPERVGEDFISTKKEWVNNPDTTSLLLQDWGVILRFQKFLKDWNRIVDLLNEKTVCKRTPKNNKTKKTKSRRKLWTKILNWPCPLIWYPIFDMWEGHHPPTDKRLGLLHSQLMRGKFEEEEVCYLKTLIIVKIM